MPQSEWLDTRSGRRVWVIARDRASEWPEGVPWTCRGFALLFAAERAFDVRRLAERALDQGLAMACAWGPGCALVEDGFDEVIVAQHPDETPDDVVLTSSHADESIGEALDFFLDAAMPARARRRGCDAWVVFACGRGIAKRVERALEARGAKRAAPAKGADA
jgi:hypothetical protein